MAGMGSAAPIPDATLMDRSELHPYPTRLFVIAVSIGIKELVHRVVDAHDSYAVGLGDITPPALYRVL